MLKLIAFKISSTKKKKKKKKNGNSPIKICYKDFKRIFFSQPQTQQLK